MEMSADLKVYVCLGDLVNRVGDRKFYVSGRGGTDDYVILAVT